MLFRLVKSGYGTVNDIENMDIDLFLNCLEYEKIITTVESEMLRRSDDCQ